MIESCIENVSFVNGELSIVNSELSMEQPIVKTSLFPFDNKSTN